VVIPAYREVLHIGATIERVRAELAAVDADGGLEILVVDDGSGDGTAEAAHGAGADRVIALPVNRGKGAAVRAGMLAARGRTVAFTDADLSYAPEQIVAMVELVESGWDVVAGNRHDPASATIVEAGTLRRIGGRAIHLATRLVVVGGHADTQCGLKAFRSDAARRLFGHSHIDGFAFDVEIIHLVERYGLSLVEVPVEVSNSDRSTVHVARDAVRLLIDLVRIRREGRLGRYDLVVPDAE
jgi:dolichyl-phosphate beta-glucosyltransferase